MKRNTLFTALLLLAMGWAEAQEAQTVMQPSRVVAKRIDEAGTVTLSHASDFTYDDGGKVSSFMFPDFDRRCWFSYNPNGSMQQWYTTQYDEGNGMYFTEYNNYFYDSQHRLSSTQEFSCHDQDLNFSGYEYTYQYNGDGRLSRKELGRMTDPDLPAYLIRYWTYEYDDKGMLSTMAKNAPGYVEEVYTYRYTDDCRALSTQTDTYDHDGNVTESQLVTYAYTGNGLLESATTQLLAEGEWVNSSIVTYAYTPEGLLESATTQLYAEGEWVNSSIVTYAYDENGRTTEVARGASLNGEWVLSKKTVYQYEGNTGYTVSFYKRAGDGWVRDTYGSQTLLFDNELKWQLKCIQSMTYANLYQHSPKIQYNQFEIDMVETNKPSYMAVEGQGDAFCAVYPNPGREGMTVKAPVENAVVRLYDMQGRLLLAKPFDFQADINTATWAPGVYLWEIWNGPQKEASGKWVKQ